MFSVDTPYYHVISRCVRRAFLCGIDRYSGKNFNHRKPWLLDRLNQLSGVFAIHIASYAIMANHYHLVVKIDPEAVESWSDTEVIERWGTLFALPDWIESWRKGDLRPSMQALVQNTIQTYRTRLCDLSWFMRCLNEYIARKANLEDQCTGRFWEGRYKSLAILDDTALLTTMAYVDLNPIRAKVAKTPESSDFTSIKVRIHEPNPKNLLPFDTAPIDHYDHKNPCLPFTLSEYLELVDWTGRIMRSDKPGAIPKQTPPILDRLQLEPEHWLKSVRDLVRQPGIARGSLAVLADYCKRLKQQWLWGMGQCNRNPSKRPVPT